MAMPLAQVWEQLGGLDYPLSKEDLLRRAQEQGADTALMQALRSLPAEQFASPGELGQALEESGGLGNG